MNVHMKIVVDKGAYAPKRAHNTDAGLDIFSTEDVEIKPFGHAIIKTGVHVQIPHGCCGLLVSKSGLNVKHDITSTGLIDEGYTGEICVKLYNHGAGWYAVNKGDKISQLVILPCLYVDTELVKELDGNTERGDNGFGSTGK